MTSTTDPEVINHNKTSTAHQTFYVWNMVLDIFITNSIDAVYDIDTINQTFGIAASYKLRWEASGNDWFLCCLCYKEVICIHSAESKNINNYRKG